MQAQPNKGIEDGEQKVQKLKKKLKKLYLTSLLALSPSLHEKDFQWLMTFIKKIIIIKIPARGLSEY